VILEIYTKKGNRRMQRRDFLKVTGVGAAAVALNPALVSQKAEAAVIPYMYSAKKGNPNKVQLVDEAGKPIKAKDLAVEENYIFNYPHAATPAILIRLKDAVKENVTLKDAEGDEYVNSDKGKSIVAYVAICPHQLTHPNPADSFFSYVPSTQKTMAYKEGGVVVCSSHLSAFDPKQGGKLVGGPAETGLAQIVIEEGADGTLWANGVRGPEKFKGFFKAFKTEFKKYYGGKKAAKKLVSISAKTVTLTKYSKEIVAY
jgi:Rieske Fe-S protein